MTQKLKTSFGEFGEFDLLNDTQFSKKKIKVFDCDDTLVITDSKIRVHDTKANKEYSLTPKQWTSYERLDHHHYDFSDFDDLEILKAGNLIESIFKILLDAYSKKIAVAIITARSDKKMIYDFLIHHNVVIHPDLIFAVNDHKLGFSGTIDDRKKQAMNVIIGYGYEDIEFYDDDDSNIQIMKTIPNISIKTYHIQTHNYIPVTQDNI